MGENIVNCQYITPPLALVNVFDHADKFPDVLECCWEGCQHDDEINLAKE